MMPIHLFLQILHFKKQKLMLKNKQINKINRIYTNNVYLYIH